MRLRLQRHPRTGGFASPSFDGYALTDDAIVQKARRFKYWTHPHGTPVNAGNTPQANQQCLLSVHNPSGGTGGPLRRCAHEKAATPEHSELPNATIPRLGPSPGG